MDWLKIENLKDIYIHKKVEYQHKVVYIKHLYVIKTPYFLEVRFLGRNENQEYEEIRVRNPLDIQDLPKLI